MLSKRALLSRVMVVVLIFTTVLSSLLFENHTAVAAFLPNATGNYDGNWWGTKSDIETANPQVRDGGYSWVRATVQYNPQDSINYYAEVGWYKNSQGTISVHVVSQDPSSGHFEKDFSFRPTPGSTHNYQLIWDSFYSGYTMTYDGFIVTNRPASASLTRVFCGAEAYTDANAIGVSGCLNNQYASTTSGGWTTFPSFYTQVASGYYVNTLTGTNFQVGGNN